MDSTAPPSRPQPAQQTHHRNRRALILTPLVVAPVAAALALPLWGSADTITTPSTPTSTAIGTGIPTPPLTPVPHSPSPSRTPRTTESSTPTKQPTGVDKRRSTQGCASTLSPLRPVTMRIDALGTTSPMTGLGTDDSGAPTAPPLSSSHGASWWTQGPSIGSSHGHAVVTVHTYRNGGAIGNTMASTLKPGDVVRFTDAAGTTQCYRISERQHVRVATWDASDGRVFNDKGAPEAVIITCTDFNWKTEVWESRWVFHLTPVAR